jgi:hypothetical protein
MIGGKFEIRKDSYNILVITGMEYGRLLKLNGTSTHTKNVAYIFDHGEGIIGIRSNTINSMSIFICVFPTY